MVIAPMFITLVIHKSTIPSNPLNDIVNRDKVFENGNKITHKLIRIMLRLYYIRASLILLIVTSQTTSNRDCAHIIASLLDDIDINHIIIGDIHSPMDALSQIFKITSNGELIGGCDS